MSFFVLSYQYLIRCTRPILKIIDLHSHHPPHLLLLPQHRAPPHWSNNWHFLLLCLFDSTGLDSQGHQFHHLGLCQLVIPFHLKDSLGFPLSVFNHCWTCNPKHFSNHNRNWCPHPNRQMCHFLHFQQVHIKVNWICYLLEWWSIPYLSYLRICYRWLLVY